MPRHRVVIVGGGAGGLELATRLGETLGRRGRADITLVDRHRSHVWKPKLHEIAAGSMDMSAHEVDYLAQAHWPTFTTDSASSSNGTSSPSPQSTGTRSISVTIPHPAKSSQ